MKILIITDAWIPQVNGVVRTLTSTIAALEQMGHTIKVISPDQFNNVPCPTYPEIRLALPFGKKIFRIFKQFCPVLQPHPAKFQKNPLYLILCHQVPGIYL
jgi:hypothetical protein